MNTNDVLLSLGTSALSDALDSLGISGGLLGIKAQTNRRCAGPAFTVLYGELEKTTQFMPAGEYIDDVKPGEVIVIDNAGSNQATTWGEILTFFAQNKKIAGTVVHGSVRDIFKIQELGFPVFSSHVFMQSGKNRVQKIGQQIPLKIGNTEILPGDIIVCDENGCVAIPLSQSQEVLKRAQSILKTEERIVEAVTSGSPLKVARQKFAYDRPWEEKC